MRRIAAILLGLVLVLPASAGAAVPDPPRYRAYVVCSAQMSAPPATKCAADQPKMAIFLSKDKDVTFTICLRYPDRTRLCAKNQFASKGYKRTNNLMANQVGRHKVIWRVAGKKVRTYRFDVKA